MTTLWQVRLFNGPVLLDAFGKETRRFRSHKVGALLAYLALHLGQACPREALYEALWPEEEPQVVANRFRVTLTSLRRHLEPDETAFGSVLDVSVPGQVRLRAETVSCDTVECDFSLRRGDRERAVQLMVGPLLPGFYEEWAVIEQARYELLREDLVTADSTLLAPRDNERTLLWDERSPRIQPDAGAAPLAPSLPLYLTRFFGRENERRILSDLIGAHRLVSLIGMGGIGKTRLAAEVAKDWEGACLFLSLLPVSDPGQLYDAILRALGVAPQTDASTEAQTVQVLNRRGILLLILDNAEHLNDAVAALALLLLEQVPKLRLLVTSRQRLNISGESVHLLTPLEAPGQPAHTERLLEFASIALFVDRAKNARPDFVLSSRHADAVVDICKRLEGIPLALELAAARITAQTPQQIAHSLEAGLTDLKARQHGLSPRHQSLRAVIQGSLDLLTAEQRDLFLALSVFQDGWSVEAAVVVTGYPEVAEDLNHLTVCSLVVVQEDERLGVMRYSLLETLRQFAAENLEQERHDLYCERHARFYVTMVIHADREDFQFMDRLEADHANLLLAMEWFWQHDQTTLRPLLVDIMNLWANRGYHRLALEWLTQKLPDTDLIAAVRQTGTMIGLRVYVDVGRYGDAETVARAALQGASDPVLITWALNGLGYVLMMQGEWSAAIASLREAIEYGEQNRQESILPVLRMCYSHIAQALNGRAFYLTDNPDPQQDYRDAERHLNTMYVSLAENNRLQAGYYTIMMRSLWGQQRMEEGDLCFARALQTAVTHRHLTTLILAIGDGAYRLAQKGGREEAVQLFAASDALQEKMGYRKPFYEAARIREELTLLKNSLGTEMFDRNWQTGLYTPLDVLVPSILPQILLRESR
ncbi:MAG: putative ATPase [Chthonomonadales bacterium]|nr:putative ATPase [Chthonomonadales bacterium]